MLFNSTVFILAFLPVVLAAYYLAAGSRNLRLNLLCLASVVFYGWWDVRLVPLLVGSATANWLLVRLFDRLRTRKVLLAGIALNLAVLAVFKYADFLVGSALAALGRGHAGFDIVLPLAISFFTFQQISYLADVQRGAKERYPFRDYLLYVTFFAQLIAGPIVRHNELIHQFDEHPRREGMWERLSRGMFLFVVGLTKKVVLADSAARVVDELYATVQGGAGIALGDAWIAASGYTIQAFFDFSGYSDMAIGLGLMFGFRLPFNFDAPYRAISIRDVWRRWHMTLTRFLRDYVYIPLGGSRRGVPRRLLNVTITFVLCGLWHGAAWTFVVFGLAHAAALIVQGAWSRLGRPLPVPLAWLLTMAFWLLAIVLFRSPDFETAWRMYGCMAGSHAGVAALHTFSWLFVAGSLIAVFGPTSQEVAFERLRPWRFVEVLVPASLVYLLLEIASEIRIEFIYFQF